MFTQGKNGIRTAGLNYGLDRVLHGEQYTEVKRPLPPQAKLTTRRRSRTIWDKGKNASSSPSSRRTTRTATSS
jgi:3-hydroxyacyl-CoA dehydrogenase/3a,7a,12a-trihydroxy-5b-cholest-24-enoyl-CoA hydratase